MLLFWKSAVSLPFPCLMLIFFGMNITASEMAVGDEIYSEQVKPLLKQRCYACHGALKQEGGLRLDTAVAMFEGGDSGAAVVPDSVADSLLLERVSADDPGERMPPEHEGEVLKSSEVQLLRQWIEAGAVAPADEQPEQDPRDHWSFQRIQRPALPQTSGKLEGENPIDRILSDQWRQFDLEPAAMATPREQVRRLYIDLIGLPPTVEENARWATVIEAQYDDLVEELLLDERHGQRWARHWMDVWRYSDWWGLDAQHRNSQKHMWHFRDWIVDSLNANVPYDQMIREMLAADELYPGDLNRLRATGYLARNWFLFNRNQWLEETVEHVGKGLLGLTLNCAKCHDHKYDPIDQSDFYRFRAFFEPYHVRKEMVPGQADLTIDSIPVVFDAELEKPTYLFVRGDASQIDDSVVMEPGVPGFLREHPLPIQSVELPEVAWRTGQRAWVLENYRVAANQERRKAEQALSETTRQIEEARKRLAALEENATEAEEQPWLIVQNFRQREAEEWEEMGGDWVYASNGVSQQLDGAQRSLLRFRKPMPRNFEAEMEFSIQGGSQWRSVGLAFDATSDDQHGPTGDDTEQSIYLSAVNGGSKLQASFFQNGVWNYPGGNAVQTRTVELDRRYRLLIKVRDTLVNVYLDDELVLRWRTPLERRAGYLQLTTFDALARIESLRLRELGEQVDLQAPDGETSPAPRTVAGAQQQLSLLEDNRLLQELDFEIASLEEKRLSQTARYFQSRENSDRESAIRTERTWDVAKRKRDLVKAHRALASASEEKRDTARQLVEEIERECKKLEAAIVDPIGAEEIPAVPEGARWVATRFLDSGKDDPTLGFPTRSSGRRTALATWLTDPGNPLVARVAVNHIWARHFGKPLVPSVFDFGRNGTPPSQRELLDWLAAELMKRQWDMRHLHRLIVTSRYYRLGSSLRECDRQMAIDPENELLWRREPLRMESQVIRDSLLAHAGVLDTKLGGPPVPAESQKSSLRRSLYFFHSNNQRFRFLTTFDDAMVKECYRREQSVVPQQALALLNSELVLKWAPAIAKRYSDASQDDASFVRLAFQQLLAMDPDPQEMKAALAGLEEMRAAPGATDESARADLIWVLINHNDFVTLR